jgi:hypothetical protein
MHSVDLLNKTSEIDLGIRHDVGSRGIGYDDKKTFRILLVLGEHGYD